MRLSRSRRLSPSSTSRSRTGGDTNLLRLARITRYHAGLRSKEELVIDLHVVHHRISLEGFPSCRVKI
jgi:hypothetical protein